MSVEVAPKWSIIQALLVGYPDADDATSSRNLLKKKQDVLDAVQLLDRAQELLLNVQDHIGSLTRVSLLYNIAVAILAHFISTPLIFHIRVFTRDIKHSSNIGEPRAVDAWVLMVACCCWIQFQLLWNTINSLFYSFLQRFCVPSGSIFLFLCTFNLYIMEVFLPVFPDIIHFLLDSFLFNSTFLS